VFLLDSFNLVDLSLSDSVAELTVDPAADDQKLYERALLSEDPAEPCDFLFLEFIDLFFDDLEAPVTLKCFCALPPRVVVFDGFLEPTLQPSTVRAPVQIVGHALNRVLDLDFLFCQSQENEEYGGDDLLELYDL